MPEEHVTSGCSEIILGEQEKDQRIEELRRLIEENESIKVRTDDVYLLRFLIVCDWNVTDAYVRITKLFKLKYEYPKWFYNRQFDQYNDLLNYNAKYMLAGRDKKGRRIYLTRISQISKLSPVELAQLDDMWLETMLNEKETVNNGIIALIDMSGFSLKMFKWLSPSNVKVASTKAELLPIKDMEVHVVNSSSLLNKAVSMVFPMLSQSLKEQIFFHGTNYTSLHEHIAQEVLPVEYGGTMKDFQPEKLVDYLRMHQDDLNKSMEYGFLVDPSSVKSKKKDKQAIADSI